MKGRILIVALLACLAVVLVHSRFQPAKGIDFYNYWAIHTALETSDQLLDHPYRDQAQYAEGVRAIAVKSSDAALRQVDMHRQGTHRRGLDLTGTPFLYTALGFLLLRDYTLAFTLFQVVQCASFLGAILLFGRHFRVNWFESSVLALVLVCVYDPFVSDLRVGNTNSLQLLAMVAMTCFADRLATRGSGEGRWIQWGLFVAGLSGLALFKPNLIAVALLLIGHVVVRQRSRNLLPTALAAAIGTAAILLVSCFYFGTAEVWGDWYDFVYGDYPGNFGTFSGARWPPGNFAVVFLLVGRLGMGSSSAVVLMSALLGASALWVLVVARPLGPSLIMGVWQSARRALNDPILTGSAGVLVLFGLSPLIWQHYHTLSLLPSLWLLWGSHRWPGAGWMGGLSIALSSGVYFGLSPILSQEVVVHCIYAASWIPLWFGLLAVVVDGKRGLGAESALASDVARGSKSTADH